MFPDFQQNISTTNDKDEMYPPTIESVLEWLSDSSVHPRDKVNSFQWFHIPTLLTTHIQSQQEQQNNEVLSQLLQRMMTILDECFDCQTPIPNKRLLHSSLSQLSQSPSLDPKLKKGVGYCFVALDSVDEGPIVVVSKEDFESMEAAVSSFSNLQQRHDELQAKLSERDNTISKLEKEKAGLFEEKKTHLSMIESHQKEKEQIVKENKELRKDLANKTSKPAEKAGGSSSALQSDGKTKTAVSARPQRIVASDVIVAFSPDKYRVSGSIVRRINSTGWAGCFTKPVSKGIHRLSIKTESYGVYFGVLDAAEYPKHLTQGAWISPKAAMMSRFSGGLFSAGNDVAPNKKPEEGQEWSAEADLEKRTLHFFVDGVQQQHHFINIHVPLVFAINSFFKDARIEITFWGELNNSSVTFAGTGHNLG